MLHIISMNEPAICLTVICPHSVHEQMQPMCMPKVSSAGSDQACLVIELHAVGSVTVALAVARTGKSPAGLLGVISLNT